MAQDIIFGRESLKKRKAGLDKVANAVKATLGPRGRNVVYKDGRGNVTITSDGVSVAKSINLKDPHEDMGAFVARDVANKTNDEAGDATTTAVVLTQALSNEGIKKIGITADAMGIRSGMEMAKEDAISVLKEMSRSISSNEEVTNIATISAASAEIGKVVADAIITAGKDGSVTVEESQSFGIESEVVKGIEIDKGYISPYMVTRPERMDAEYKNVPVLITDHSISYVRDLIPLLEQMAQAGRKELVIIADNIDGEALNLFVLNKLRGAFNVLGIRAPGYGDRKRELLQDIAVTVGAKVISKDAGGKISDIKLSDLGKCESIVSTKDNTIITNGQGKKEDIDARVEFLKSQKENASKYEVEELEKRIARLTGGIVVLRAGASTEAEMSYLRLRIEDAVNATKAAIEEGIVAGGGTVLVRVAAELEKRFDISELTHDEKVGYKIVIKALEAPLRQIVVNGGVGLRREMGWFRSVISRILGLNRYDCNKIIKAVKESHVGYGYDAKNCEMVNDMFESGIIDPVKATRCALKNAISGAGMMLTIDPSIADEPETPHQHD